MHSHISSKFTDFIYNNEASGDPMLTKNRIICLNITKRNILHQIKNHFDNKNPFVKEKEVSVSLNNIDRNKVLASKIKPT